MLLPAAMLCSFMLTPPLRCAAPRRRLLPASMDDSPAGDATDLNTLQTQLYAALSAEDYETAIELRDRRLSRCRVCIDGAQQRQQLPPESSGEAQPVLAKHRSCSARLE